MTLSPAHAELIKLLARQVVAECMGQSQPVVTPQTLTTPAQGSNNQKNPAAKQNHS
jgi:hypothetical protein